jgi:hypothetical protein
LPLIVLSLVLVIVAAVTLVLGVFQDGLTLIYFSIGACLAAMVLLGIGVLLRRRADAGGEAPATAGYGPGAGSAAATATTDRVSVGAPVREQDRTAEQEEVVVRQAPESTAARPAKKAAVVKKVAASHPTRDDDEAPAGDAPDRDAAGELAERETEPTSEIGTASEDAVVQGTATAAAAATGGVVKKVAAKRTTAKKVAVKKVATKKATAKKATTKKATAKKATKKAATRSASLDPAARLSAIKGLGPGKADALLAEFGSLDAIRDATPEELSRVRGVGERLAQSIKDDLG